MRTLLAAAVLALCASVLNAATIHVPADQPTIQAGVDAAVNGDTVLVHPGTYTGVGNHSILVHGKDILVKGRGGRDSTIIDVQNEADYGFGGSSDEDNNAVLEGFTIRNAVSGIWSSELVFPTIRELRISGMSGRGIHLEDNLSRLISNCQIDSSSTGIYKGYSLTIDSCQVFDCETGVRIVGSSVLQNSSVARCTTGIYPSGAIQITNTEVRGCGLGLRGSTPPPVADTCSFIDNVTAVWMGDAHVKNSIISGGVSGFGSSVSPFGDNTYIDSCVIEGITGTVFGGGNQMVVTYTTIRDNPGVICDLSPDEYLEMEGCDLYGNTGGMRKWSAGYLWLTRCIYHHNEEGIDVSNTTLYLDTCTLASNAGDALVVSAAFNKVHRISGCIVAHNWGTGIIVDTFGYSNPSSLDLSCNDVYDNAGGDWAGEVGDQTGLNGNISANPLFCDTALGDYHIFSTSPCAPYNNSCGVLMGALGVGCSVSPPSFDPISDTTITEMDSLNITVTAASPDSLVPTLSATGLPDGATFTDHQDGSGSFAWQTNNFDAGNYEVAFLAVNPMDTTLRDSQAVTITVLDSNLTPVLTTPPDTSINEGALLELLVTASDPDSTVPSLAADNLPDGAAFVDSGNGVGLFTWTPDYEQAGVHPIMFVASDATLADSAVVQITVNNVNRPPVMTQPVDTAIGEGSLLELIVRATDPDSTIPSLFVDSLPPGATFVDSSNGAGLLTWMPDFTQAGVYNVVFIAADDSSAVDSGVTVITVNHVNLPPILDSIGTQELFESQHLEFVVTTSDFDEDELTLIADGLPENASFADSGNGHGLFQFDPQPDQGGVHPVLFVVSDGSLDDSELVEITVHDSEPIINTILVAGEVAPQHVLIHSPLIEWSYTDPLERRAQTQVEVAVGSDDDWQYAEMWNPAPFQTPDTFLTYAGIGLLDGETYYLRLRVHNGVAWSNWYETSFRMNSLPSVPAPLSPIGDEEAGNTPTLTVQVASDAEADILTYDFYALNDSTCGDLTVYDTTGIPEGDAVALWQVDPPMQENCRHWWRARAFDGYEYSDWTDLQSFYVNGTPEPPTAPQAQYPPDTSGLPVFNMLPTFSWSQSIDPDPLDVVRYKLEVSINPQFTFLQTIDSIPGTSFTLTDSLLFDTHYWWRVRAFDNTGLSTMSPNTPDFWTWTLGDLDHSHSVDISDLVMLVDWMFSGGPAPYPLFVADIDGSCSVDISDLVYLVDYMFVGGPAPLAGCGSGK